MNTSQVGENTEKKIKIFKPGHWNIAFCLRSCYHSRMYDKAISFSLGLGLAGLARSLWISLVQAVSSGILN